MIPQTSAELLANLEQVETIAKLPIRIEVEWNKFLTGKKSESKFRLKKIFHEGEDKSVRTYVYQLEDYFVIQFSDNGALIYKQKQLQQTSLPL